MKKTTAQWIDQLLAQIDPQPNGCIHFTGSLDKHGYGFLYHPEFLSPGVHRGVYTVFIGPIPDGLVIDHLCHNADPDCVDGNACLHRRCVEPSHLTVVSNRENILRGNSPFAVNARKTHCLRGHPFDEANTYYERDGRRKCRTCKRDQMRGYRAKAKGSAC